MTDRFRIMAVLFLSLAAGSCKLGPDYQRPELDLPESFLAESSETDPSHSLAAQHWQAVYADENLQQLIETGLSNNLDLETARSRMRAAEARLTIARAPLYPGFGAGFVAERESESELTGGSGEGEDEISLLGLLSWELDLWGRNRRSAEAARARYEAGLYDLHAQQVSLIGAISATYFNLLSVRKQIEITQVTVDSRRETVRIQRMRNENGIISGLEVTQAEVALAETERNLPRLENRRLVFENQLNLLLGNPPGAVSLADASGFKDITGAMPTGVPSELLQRRPDIRSAELELAASSAEIGVAKANLFPRISLTGAYGTESEDLSDLLRSDGLTWIATVDVFQPIFNAGANRAAVSVAEERYEQSLLNYRKIVLQSLGEVADALDKRQRALEIADSTQDLRDASTEYLRLANLRYNNGVLGYIDVLDAQRQYFDAQLTLVEARRDQQLAISLLYRALGGGWQTGNPATP